MEQGHRSTRQPTLEKAEGLSFVVYPLIFKLSKSCFAFAFKHQPKEKLSTPSVKVPYWLMLSGSLINVLFKLRTTLCHNKG